MKYKILHNIIFESIVLVIYLCFRIYFLIDQHYKSRSELADMLKNIPNLLNFLQGFPGSYLNIIQLNDHYQTVFSHLPCHPFQKRFTL